MILNSLCYPYIIQQTKIQIYISSRFKWFKKTYPVMYNWSRGGPTGSAPSDMGHAMCNNESRTITSQAVTCVVPVHSETRSHRTNRPRFPRFLRRNIVIVSNLCCWLLLPLPPGIAPNVCLGYK